MDFNDEPTQTKFVSKKRIAIIIGGVFLAVGVVWLTIYLLNRKPFVVSSSLTTSVQSEAVDDCINAEDPEGCRGELIKTTALLQQNVDVCSVLQDVAKDDCVWGVAREKKDPKICSSLSVRDDVTHCSDNIYATLATDSSEQAMCDKIIDNDMKNTCHQEIEGPITSSNCVSRKQDPLLCEMLNITDQAIAADDRSVCDRLADSRIDACKTRVIVDDPDHDGLDSTQETDVYHTDPHNSDTDGDGYTDDSEIASGHDPLKK